MLLQKQAISPSSFQKSFHVYLDGFRGGNSVEVDGTAFTHKFDDPGRFSFMWTSHFSLPETGVTFVEKGWVVAAPCSVSSLGRTVVKTCYLILCVATGRDGLAAGSAAQDPKDELEKRDLVAFVLRRMSRSTRDYNEQMQDLLVDRSS